MASILLLTGGKPLLADTTVITLKVAQSEISLYKMDTLFVSKDCLTGDCLALRPADKKAPPPDSPWVGHPAAAFCRANNGDYIVGNHPNGNEDGVCRFKDGSMIMDWDYYYRNRPKSKADMGIETN